MIHPKHQQGQILIPILILGFICVLFFGGMLSWMIVQVRASRHDVQSEQAFHIAEAGIDYYRWHLAHDPQDFQDGTGVAGPYVHTYVNKGGTVIGYFSLNITPPAVGSTILTIESTGTIVDSPTIQRTIQVQLGIPSWAQFAVVANEVNGMMRFGPGTEVFGPVHSNGGIRFDGLAHNIVSSAKSQFDDPDHTGGEEFGVHTHLGTTDPLPPEAVPSRTDVFEVGREFPVPAVDFTGLTEDLAQMKVDAEADGLYFANSGAQGYHIVLKTDDTFDLYMVNTLQAAPSGCTNSQNQSGWSTWSISSTSGSQTLLGNYPFPSNGLVFLEDHTWVDGQINSARLTIAAARFPEDSSQYKNIIVNNDITYTNHDGQDVVALIAQGNFNVGMYSEDDLYIEAALIAQNGRVGRHYYRPPTSGNNRCSPYHVRTKLTLNGMIATNVRYGFAYTDGNGYATRSLNYDANLLYSPPPSFPLTSGEYSILAWEEIGE